MRAVEAAPAGDVTSGSDSWPAVELDAVSLTYGRVPALAGASLDVPTGRLVGVLGPSGCGKSTLLRVIAGFVRPDSGRVRIAGTDVCSPGRMVAPERRGVGIVPQDSALFPHLTVAGNIGYGLPRRTSTRAARIAELLELLGLAGLGHRHPDELSGGQQQRVALARALAPRPRVILLDEPFSALDAGLRATVRADIRDALRHEGATAILVTHDQDEALAMSDLVAVMRAGAITEVGTPEQVYHEPRSLATARFVGDLVELPGVLAQGGVRTALGLHSLRRPAAATPGSQVRVGIRPEQLRLRPSGAGSVPAAPSSGVTAVVVDVDFHGHDAYVHLHTDARHHGAPARLLARTHTSWQIGGDVDVTVRGPVLAFSDS